MSDASRFLLAIDSDITIALVYDADSEGDDNQEESTEEDKIQMPDSITLYSRH